MLTFGFDKSRAEYFIECLENGKRLEPRTDPVPTGEWTRHDLLQLAGACISIYLQGQPNRLMDAIASGDFADMHGEHKEAVSHTAEQDIENAASFCAKITAAVCDGTYDQQYEPIVYAKVWQDGEGKRCFDILRGSKIDR